jgi:EAL and modified HD-GYP domain-containing signal transduction protein
VKSFFQRVLPGVFGKAADPQASVIDRSKTVAVPPSSPVTAPSVGPLGQVGGASGIGARRPLIAADGAVAGFEFRIGNQMMRRLQGRPDERTQAAHVAAVLTAASWVTQKGRTGVARMPADWLVHAAGMNVGPGVMIALEEPAGPAPQPELVDANQTVTRQLRENGVKLGWELMSNLGLDPDFVLIRQGSQDMAAMMAAMRAWPAALKGLPVIATDIVSTEDLELALQGGVAYACGALVPRAERDEVVEVKPVPPEVRRIGHLLNQLVTGADTSVIVSEIKIPKAARNVMYEKRPAPGRS